MIHALPFRSRRFLSAAGAALLLSGCAAEHENVVHVIAEQAVGLKKAARVTYRGVDVGSVKQVYFTPGGVRIDLVIERKDVPIRTQDTVKIASVGAFGEQVVSISPGVQSAPLIHRGDSLPKISEDSTVSLPIGVWRSIVKTLGMSPDSARADSAKAASTAPKKP